VEAEERCQSDEAAVNELEIRVWRSHIV